jgi:hypothetical protein
MSAARRVAKRRFWPATAGRLSSQESRTTKGTAASDGNSRFGIGWRSPAARARHVGQTFRSDAVVNRRTGAAQHTRPRVRSPGDAAAKVAGGTVPAREARLCADFPIGSE